MLSPLCIILTLSEVKRKNPGILLRVNFAKHACIH